MKIKKLILLTGCATALAAAVVYTINHKVKKELYTDLPEGFTITAHTGCEGTEDNTLESIRAGASAGADIVEIDLQFLTDGTPVLCHNEPKGKNYPTLDSAFELLKGLPVKMNVDVKSVANISEVKRLAEKYGVLDRIFFTGVEEEKVKVVKNGAPDIAYFLNVGVDKKKNTDKEYLDSLVKKVKDCGAVGINMNHKGCSKALVEAFRKEGRLVSLWTANSKKIMGRCLYYEPDNITTRKPSELLQLMANV
ncbi:MAG: glycerophosphodiester phosphodiesterase [Clostridia bacterium]|nr:glycerophosphodiester phosphodiesterase [Clostridia bacterium]